MKSTVSVLCLSVFLAGCLSGVKSSNPQQAVFQLETGLKDAETVAVAYDSLPSCSTGATLVCSSTNVAVQLKNAKDVAQVAVSNAEKAVRDPNFAAGGVSEAIVSAQAAVAALTAITTLDAVQSAVKGVKKP
jgi:hypothetical protein